ncbi:MAG: VWA domain-containing protein [Burkholderiaceae bacterium]|nr:VWA domain-containing protein [Burkholderiaceae bacterium]
MAEAEDVITDVARHATIYARDAWRRHRAGRDPAQPQVPELRDVARRLDLLLTAVFGRSFPIRVAQPPAPTTLLVRLFRRREAPWPREAVPATDGESIWLPARWPRADAAAAVSGYRAVALRLAAQARRGSAGLLPAVQAAARDRPALRDAYLLMEAQAADEELQRLLPGTVGDLDALRRAALDGRPPLAAFAPYRQPLERWLRTLLEGRRHGTSAARTPAESLARAGELVAAFDPPPRPGAPWLLPDWWTGELRAPAAGTASGAPSAATDAAEADLAADASRTARLSRRPTVREAAPDEDDERQGAFMVQTAQPHEHAEDPAGMQRPVDRDSELPAEDFAEDVSDLPQARLVSTPGTPREFLLSDDPPEARERLRAPTECGGSTALGAWDYPEWDWQKGSYVEPGARVWLLEAPEGPQAWVDRTLARHGALLDAIRRRFEMLRAQPERRSRQLEGDDIDLEALVAGHADFRAGLPREQAIYQSRRRARRDMAIMLVVDASGSTDAWIAAERRIIDVEREALLLVSAALESMGEAWAVLSFSGEGPRAVGVRSLKAFDEPHGETVARRIAALEPERYTRAGAAIRHATAQLMRARASHRLLLLLSDGKPNDADGYDGRYGVEDTRQAVNEARAQGIFPFCLTVDRQAADYLPTIFGAGQYGLLAQPERLPTLLLDWMRRLVSA